VEAWPERPGLTAACPARGIAVARGRAAARPVR